MRCEKGKKLFSAIIIVAITASLCINAPVQAQEANQDTLQTDVEKITEGAELTKQEIIGEETEQLAEPEESVEDEKRELQLLATSHTQAEALAWVKAQVGKAVDYDGSYGAQCVDLIKEYYNYLGVAPVRGNGKDYATNALPAGWSRYQGAVPQPGDVLVYTGGSYGHVAIFESANSTYHQNYNGHAYVEKISTTYNQIAGVSYWGVIRPDFKAEPSAIRRGSPLPEGAPRTIADGDYHIVSAVEGDRFNPGVKGLTTGGLPNALNTCGANMELWPSSEWENSVFTVTWIGNGFYKIKLKDSTNMCLDVAGGDTAIGTNVQQWEDNGQPAQQWQINETDGNGYTLQSRCNGWFLDVEGGNKNDGTNVRLWEGNGANAERWYFIPWGGGSSAKQELADGTYHIVPKAAPDKALNAGADGVTNETNIILWPCRNDGRHTFQVKWLGNGYYEIINKNSGLALDVSEGLSKRGANVQLYQNLNENNKKWLIRSCGDGYFNIISKCNGLYLDLLDGKTDDATNIHLWVGWGLQGGDSQKWRFIPWGESIGQTVKDGEYQIVSSSDSGKTLSISGNGAKNGTNIELNACKDDERHTFNIQYLGNGEYSIVNRDSGLSLDVESGGWDNGCNVQLWEQNMEDVQRWMIRDCGDGTCNIISKRSGLNIDLAGGNTANGTNIRVWARNEANAQKWRLEPCIRPGEANKETTANIISSNVIKASSIKIVSKLSNKVAAGKKIKLAAEVSPSNATNKNVTWTSGNSKVATVDSSGVVTMKKKSGGKSVTITATAADGSGVSADYKIKSMKGVVKKVAVFGKKTVKAGKTLKLKAKVTATKKANKKLKWTSSNEQYATVSSSGKVKALKAGKGKKVRITAMATDGSGKKRAVTIKIK